MDIGTLTGQIAIEDQLSSALDIATSKVKKFVDNFDGAFGAMAIGAGAAIAAVTAVTAAITNLGSRGADINDVAATMDQFTGSAAKSTEILEKMSAGALHTVDDFTLMKSASKLLSAGTLKNAEDFGTLTQAAFVLQNRGLGTTEQMMQTLQQSLITGRSRTLAAAGVFVDMQKATLELAASLGKSSDQLTAQERRTAAATATMAAMRDMVAKAGAQQRDFGEQLEAASVFAKKFVDDLARQVAASPAVMKATEDIGKAFQQVFGSETSGLIAGVMAFINGFAEAVSATLPPVVEFAQQVGEFLTPILRATGSVILSVWDAVKALAPVVVDLTKIIWFLITPLKEGLIQAFDLVAFSVKGLSYIIEGLSIGFEYLLTKVADTLNWIADHVEKVPLLGKAFGGLADGMKFATTAAREHKPAVEEVTSSVVQGTGAIEGMTTAVDTDIDSLKEHDKAMKAAAERAAAHKKAVEDLVRTLTTQTDSVVVTAEAFGQLTAKQLANIDTQKKLLPLLEAYAAANGALTPKMLAVYTATLNTLEAQSKQSAAVILNDKALQARIKTLQDSGRTETQIATQLGITTAALQRYSVVAKAQEENTKNLLAIQAAWVKDLEEKTRTSIEASRKGIDTNADAIQSAQNAIDERTKSSYDYRRQILAQETAAKKLALDKDVSNYQDAMNLIDQAAAATWNDIATDEWAAGKELETQTVLTLDNLATSFQKIGQAAGGALGQLFGQMGGLINVANEASKAGKSVGGSFGYASVMFDKNADAASKANAAMGIATNTMAGVQGFQAAFDQKSTGKRLLGSTMAGMQIGASFGPYGMAVGAAAGFIAGLIKGKPQWAKTQEDMAKQFGVNVSDELSHSIADTAKTQFGGNQRAAEISHLTDIIKDAGGITEQNLPKLTARLHDVFSMIETHQFTVAQGSQIITENWDAFATAGTSAAGLLKKDLVDIIKLNDQFGTNSKAIAQYLGQQGQAGASAFGAYLTVGAQAIQRQQELAASANATSEELQTQQNIIDATTIKTQAAADAMAYAVSADFYAMLDAGMSFSDAVAAVQPAIDALAVQMDAAGLSGSAAFQLLKDQVSLYSDEVAGPALSSVDALTQGMVALDNMGKGNQETFAALSGQVTQTFQNLVAQGKDSSSVMLAMRDSLQRMWEEQQEFGYTTDDATQALIDQAEAEGLVGETHKSISQQMLDATNKMVDALGAIATSLGATMPNAAVEGAAGVQAALNGIHAPDLTVKIHYDESGKPSYASGGGLVTPQGVVQYRAEGGPIFPVKGTDTVPAMLTPGERVLSVSQNNAYEQNITGPSNQDVVNAIDGLRTDMSTKLPRSLARSLHTALAGLRTAS